MNKYDVVIIGAGPAGIACAISLVKIGIQKIAIVDYRRESKYHIGESLPPDINLVLKDLGIYNDFINEGHQPNYGSCSYWGSHLRGYNDFMLSPHGHGWHLDRLKFNAFLLRKAKDLGIRIFLNHRFLRSELEDQKHIISTSDLNGTTVKLQANFIVDASGSKSCFTAQLGVEKINTEPVMCLASRFKIDKNCSMANLTFLESMPIGWWYAAHIPHDQILVALYSDTETIRHYRLFNSDVWTSLLKKTRAIFKMLGDSSPLEEKIMGFKAESSRLTKFYGEKWMAIGDAAMTFDPITAHGMTKAMKQGIKASYYIKDYLIDGIDKFEKFGDELKLEYNDYNQERINYYRQEKRWHELHFWKIMHSQKM